MGLREDAVRAHPDFPWLAEDDLEGLRRYLSGANWLKPGEEVRACARAGEGNMNLTLRVRTDRRSFIVKQARPWVEKYPDIPAPWDRSRFEQRFYARAAAIPDVAHRMPELLGRDSEARVLLLEDLEDAHDCSPMYAGARAGADLVESEIQELAAFLRALHETSEGEPDPEMANREMRALNHAHIYEIPLSDPPSVELDALEPGLAAEASWLRDDPDYRDALRETGERYLRDGRHLLHGDYFPGSWLRCRAGLRVIDPEFGYFGDPEFDLGCGVAHLALAQQPRSAADSLLSSYALEFDESRLARYAAAEVMRRLIGVAQLPIPARRGDRRALLARSRQAMLESSRERLWAPA